MKKIAMLNCLRANEVCAGAACMKAWNEKSKSFSRYGGEETELAAFMRCNGCGSEPGLDKGLQEKINRLVKIGTDAVHVGVCTKNKEGERCETILKIMNLLEENGIAVVDGTH